MTECLLTHYLGIFSVFLLLTSWRIIYVLDLKPDAVPTHGYRQTKKVWVEHTMELSNTHIFRLRRPTMVGQIEITSVSDIETLRLRMIKQKRWNVKNTLLRKTLQISKCRIIDWLTDWLTDWLIDWLIDWSCVNSHEEIFNRRCESLYKINNKISFGF